MNIIKLDATTSTNDYLKSMLQQQFVENFCVIVAKNQTHGKGQRGANWQTEPDKNLTMSVFVKDLIINTSSLFVWNTAVAIAIIFALKSFKIPSLAIKWPNDIMSGNKKIGGILIENIFKSNAEYNSIVGIGININQDNFLDLPKASSLKNIMNTTFEIATIRDCILQELKKSYNRFILQEFSFFWETYLTMLYKKGVPMVFEDSKQKNKFMGIIKGVTSQGLIEIVLENDTSIFYDTKEVTMLY